MSEDEKVVDGVTYQVWADSLNKEDRSMIFRIESRQSYFWAYWMKRVAILFAFIAVAYPISVKLFVQLSDEGSMYRFVGIELAIILLIVATAWYAMFHDRRRWYLEAVAETIMRNDSKEPNTMPSLYVSKRKLKMYQKLIEKSKAMFKNAADSMRQRINTWNGIQASVDDPNGISYKKLMEKFRYELEKRTMINLPEEKLITIFDTFATFIIETAVENRPKEFEKPFTIRTPFFALRVSKFPARGNNPDCYGVAFGEPRHYVEELNKDIIQKKEEPTT